MYIYVYVFIIIIFFICVFVFLYFNCLIKMEISQQGCVVLIQGKALLNKICFEILCTGGML